jgi:HAD superfamily hydrolase (TIGR01509 family)
MQKSYAVAFDIGNTIIDMKAIQHIALNQTGKMLQEHGLIQLIEAFETTYLDTAKKFQGPEVNHLFSKPIDIMKNVLQACNIDNQVFLFYTLSIYRKAIIDQLWPDAGLKDLLTRLKLKGYKLGIASDGSLDEQILTLFKLDILTFFDAVVISELVGMTKPASKFFDTLSSELMIPTENIVMVGDDFEKDILGAKELGLKTIWVKDASEEVNFQVREGFADMVIARKQIPTIDSQLSNLWEV